MEKLGVKVDDVKVKTASNSKVCPKCGSPLEGGTNVPHCPKCGTKPFESPPGKTPRR